MIDDSDGIAMEIVCACAGAGGSVKLVGGGGCAESSVDAGYLCKWGWGMR